MDFHLDRTLLFKISPADKSLYKWSIVEVDDRGNEVGHDQIPWGWTTSFRAFELAVRDSLRFETMDLRGNDRPDPTLAHRSVIQARLRPGSVREDPLWPEPEYRMFGTDRVIKDFRLDIMAETADQPAGTMTWGSVSYTSEIDFTTDTTSDIVQFYMMVPQATFDRYVWNIGNGLADELILSVGFVAGFYSEWSPSIATRSIKVLAGDEHKFADLGENQPPRLGKVGKSELFMNARRDLRTRSAAPQYDGGQDAEQQEEGRRQGFRWPGRR